MLSRLAGKAVVVFDWDGTLFDSMEYKHRNFCTVLSEFCGIPASGVAAISVLHARYTGLPRRRLFDSVAVELRGAPLSEEEFAALSRLYTELNMRSCASSALFPDATYAMRTLRDACVKLYVSSSADPAELTAAVRQSGLSGYVEAAFGSTGRFDKGRQHLQHIAEREGKPMSALLFVGDDVQDQVLGAEAGVDTVRVLRDLEQPGPTLGPVFLGLDSVADAVCAALLGSG